jgi:asparagine synthase (glutamine-hydrolysing)
MRVPDKDAYILIRKDAAGVQWRGQRRFFRGHRLAAAPGEQPDGIFAEWVWDGDQLIVRNDRYGIAPLFYAEHGRALAVSPSIETLLALGVPTDVDEAALAVFLRLGFFVGDDTPFRCIRAVPPAARFCWTDGVLSIAGGYTIPRSIDVTREQALDGFVNLFHRAVERRLSDDERVVVPLSGGPGSRQILFELCALGRPPRCAVTIPRYPPQTAEDERLAPLVAGAAGVPHVRLDRREGRLDAELVKNRATHLCAGEHGWYVPMIDALRSTTTVYDGLGGALSAPSTLLSRAVLDLFEAGRHVELARRLLDAFSLYDEAFLRNAVAPQHREEMSRDRAVARLAIELARHAAAPDPVKSFEFWNRLRRERALVPYALMRRVPAVYTPYLDRDVYDFMMALAPTVLSPALAAADRSFHSDAIRLAFPEHAHLPVEAETAPETDASAHRTRFARHAARHLLSHANVPSRVLNRGYMLPRLVLAAVRSQYSASHPWIPSLALYLFQLDATAARMGEDVVTQQGGPAADVPDVLTIAQPPRGPATASPDGGVPPGTTSPAAVLPFDRQRSA